MLEVPFHEYLAGTGTLTSSNITNTLLDSDAHFLYPLTVECSRQGNYLSAVNYMLGCLTPYA